jgi:hypothetical protein
MSTHLSLFAAITTSISVGGLASVAQEVIAPEQR